MLQMTSLNRCNALDGYKYAGDKTVLGGDLNSVMNEFDKCRGRRSFEQKKTVIQEMKTLMRTHNLIDT